MTLPVLDPLALFDVAGKTAIIIGATGAFGKVACSTLGKAGANLVITAGDAAQLATLHAELDTAGFPATRINRRPNSAEDCAEIVTAATAAYGSIDILVVASSVNDVAMIGDLTPERFQKVMLANVESAWLIARAVGTQMIAQGGGGKVVFTSSARGKLGHPAGYSAYCTSKAAIDGLTKALGCEWGKHGITVNAIAPTVFRSPLTAWMFEDNANATKVREGVSRPAILTPFGADRLSKLTP